jgi:hypothetical protein
MTSYILGSGPDTRVVFGGILEVIVAFAGIGTAVALYPVLKRQNQGATLGLVGSRVLEAAGILAGVACLRSIVSLRQAGAGDRSAGRQSRLVPRVLPWLAFIGASLLLASWIGVLLGLWEQRSTVSALAALPVALFEFSLGVYLVVKGFRPSPITAEIVATDGASARQQLAS